MGRNKRPIFYCFTIVGRIPLRSTWPRSKIQKLLFIEIYLKTVRPFSESHCEKINIGTGKELC